MSGDVFVRPARGVGADTGANECVMPAQLGFTTFRDILQYESDDARRNGPVLLTVFSNTSQLVFGVPVPRNQSVPLPSVNRGQWVYGQYDAEWVDFAGNRPYVGSLIITMQTGAVVRTVVADLISGTYQIPPCDRLTVTVGLRRVDYPEENGNDLGVWVQASVTPGRSSAAQPLLFSDMGLWRELVGESTVRKGFWAPEGATRVKLSMMYYGDSDPGLPYPTMVARLMVGNYAEVGQSWVEVLAAQTIAWASFEIADGTAFGWPMMVGAIWQIDL